MKNLYIKYFKKGLRILIINLGIIFAFLLIYAGLFPVVKENAGEFDALYEFIPEALASIDPETFQRFELFLTSDFYSFLWPIIIVILIANLSSSAIAKEIQNGTIFTILSQPISRTQFYISKYLSGLSILTIFVIISILSAIPAAIIFGVNPGISSHFALLIPALFFGIFIYSFGVMISAFVSTKGKVGTFVSIMVLGMYIINFIAQTQEKLEFLKYFSVFNYFEYLAALKIQSINWSHIGLLTLASVIFFFIGMIKFNKRDIS